MIAKHMSKDDFHWLVGIMEGEGSFCKPRTGRISPRLFFGSTDRDVAERVSRLLGNAKLWSRQPDNPNWKEFFYVCWSSLKAADLMREMLPYMGERRQKQIRAALDDVPETSGMPCDECGTSIPLAAHRRRRFCSEECAHIGGKRKRREYMTEYRKRVA